MMALHDGQLPLDESLAASLIRRAVPEAAGESIRHLPSPATVHAIYRIGSDSAARFPLTVTSCDDVRRELDALTEFADVCPVAAPRPLRAVEATSEYPSAWSVLSWVDGVTADTVNGSGTALARDIGALILVLRSAPTEGRLFDGRGRGGSLRDHAGYVEKCLALSGHLFDEGAARDLWRRLQDTPSSHAEVMSHRDLIPPNIIVKERGREVRLEGVLDGGSFGPADPALDLIVAWHLFDANERAVLRDIVGADDEQWRRSAAWALQQSVGLGYYYESSNPTMSQLGIRTMERLLTDGGL